MVRFRRSGGDQGAAAVEFALVLPVLMLLIFGIIDFGRMLNVRLTLDQAAHEAARAAAIVGADAAQSTLDQALGSTPADRAVTGCADNPGGDASVTLTHQFDFVTPLVGNALTITARAVVPCL